MSDKSKIEWTDATWNPVTGCSHVSAGCKNCYAETFANRFKGVPGHHFETGFAVTLRPEALDIPLRWQKPRKIFVNSMSDLFHDEVPFEFIDRVFQVMERAKRHTFQVLTKRPERMLEYLTQWYARKQAYADKFKECPTEEMRNSPAAKWAQESATTPAKNIWLGVSTENQQTASKRIPFLLQCPAAVRFISAEPLLGGIDLTNLCDVTMSFNAFTGEAAHVLGMKNKTLGKLDWVIAGGESGRSARPMHPEWIRSLLGQCLLAKVPFFFKQWGEFEARGRHSFGAGDLMVWPDGETLRLKGLEFPVSRDAAIMRKVGKYLAGRELSSCEWNEFPE